MARSTPNPHCLGEHSAPTEVSSVCSAWYSGCWLRGTPEHLKCGLCDRGTTFPFFILFHLKSFLSCPLKLEGWPAPVATVVDGDALDR